MSPIFYKISLNFMKRTFINPLYSKSLRLQTHEKGDSDRLSLLDSILQLLCEKNDWCNLEEIACKTKSTESETATLLDFLSRYGFAILNTHNRKARIKPRIRQFLEEIKQVETEESP